MTYQTTTKPMGLIHDPWIYIDGVATLALGSRPKQGLARVWAKREAPESNLMLPKVQKSVRKWTFTLQSEFPF
jgi:hypothetical protein